MKKVLIITIIFLVAFGALAFDSGSLPKWSRETIRHNIPISPDVEAIRQTIRKAYEIEERAARTFDTTEFATVFINDPRGGKLDASTLQFVEEVLGRDLTSAGYLDYKLAYYKWWESGALKIEALQSKVQAEGRSLTQEEISLIVDSSGRIAMPRAQGPVSEIWLEFFSISIDGDVAIAIFDDGPRTNKMTLIKKDGRWYIAGNEILSVHP